ncbi:MAG: flagellar basal body L-ring protein FlgH [SAR324 cluster bacterium]|nr:flagellar basal body L-ring protein FlgH [SAR324 cluster bacterium]
MTLLALAAAAALAGCIPFSAQQEAPESTSKTRDDLLRQERFRNRPPISSRRNLYEGSLWRGAASWGNLMRDHRARYRGDLLTVIDMSSIINVPEALPETPEEAPAEQPQQVDPVIAFLRAQERRREAIEKEQNEIMRSIKTIEVEVAGVLPNGNLLVRGIHPPIFRERNRVKYIVTLQGIVRPRDVDDRNQVVANKLSKADYKIKRLVRRSAVARQSAGAAAAAARSKPAQFVDRLSSFLTRPRGSPPQRAPR